MSKLGSKLSAVPGPRTRWNAILAPLAASQHYRELLGNSGVAH